MEENMTNNGWTKIVIGALITIALSIGGSLWSTGEATGTTKEKIFQLELKVEKAEKLYQSDHDLLLRMDGKLQNIENLLKQMQEVKGK